MTNSIILFSMKTNFSRFPEGGFNASFLEKNDASMPEAGPARSGAISVAALCRGTALALLLTSLAGSPALAQSATGGQGGGTFAPAFLVPLSANYGSDYYQAYYYLISNSLITANGGNGGNVGLDGGQGMGLELYGLGGTAGTAASPDGTFGTDGLAFTHVYGSQGGGGGGGGYSNTSADTIINSNLTGGNGGAGGTGGVGGGLIPCDYGCTYGILYTGGGGGGGGAGGDGLVSSAAGAVTVMTGITIQGGNGGAGGYGSYGYGGGGGGGAGLVAAGTSSTPLTLANNGTIAGGDGGNGNIGSMAGHGGGAGGTGSGGAAGGMGCTGGPAIGYDGIGCNSGTGDGGGGGGGAGVLGSDLIIRNTGTIAGGKGGIGGDFGVGDGGAGGAGIVGTNLAINNTGTIAGGNGGIGGGLFNNPGGGAGGAGIIDSGLAITNAGTISGGNGGDGYRGGAIHGDGSRGGAGGAGVSGSHLTISNNGIISGGSGGHSGDGCDGCDMGNGGDGAAGGIGISGSHLAITNASTVAGGNGGNGGNGGIGIYYSSIGSILGNGGAGGAGSAGMSGSNFTIINTGTISGGNGGNGGNGGANANASNGGNGGTGGVGIVGSDLAIINAGIISGGNGGIGGTGATNYTGGAGANGSAGANGAAIVFTGGTNSLELRAGSVINGNVVGATGAGTSNTLILGGAADASFNASAIGSQYVNFTAFQKAGASNWTVTGTNSDTTPWAVKGGTLSVNGSLASTVTVNSGGTLGGTGSIAGAGIASGGVLAPGNSIGTLTVNGNLSFAAGSIYRVEINADGTHDLMNVTGSVMLNGGTVDVQAGSGRYASNTRYTILHGDGPLAGTFAGVTSNLAFLKPTLIYQGSDVLLNMEKIPYASVAQTSNQSSLAQYLSNLPAESSLLGKVDNLSADQARSTFSQMAASSYPSASLAAISLGKGITGTLMGRMSGSRRAMGMRADARFDGLRLAAADNGVVSDGPSPLAQMLGSAAGTTPVDGVWGQFLGGGGRIASDGNGARSDYRTGGFVFGIDHAASERWLFGASLGYQESHWDSTDAASGRIHTPQATLYARYTNGPWQVRTDLGYARHRFTANRAVTIGAATEQLSSSHRGGEWSAAAELEYALQAGDWEVKPLAGLRHAHLSENGFTERGGDAALTVHGRTTQNTDLSAGVRLLRPLGDDSKLELKAALSHLFGDTDSPINARLANQPGAGFTSNGAPLKRDALQLSAGVSGELKRDVTGFGFVAGETRGSGQSAWAATVGVRYEW